VLALENYEQVTSAELAALIERLGNSSVGICLDTANSLGAMELPRQIVANLGPHVRNLHLKDFTIRRLPCRMGFEIIGCPAGEGKLEIDWTIGQLRNWNRDPTLLLEQWTPWSGTIERTIALEEEWAERSFRFLERYR
jgi:sugar phosphate isomerase/epimerase